tara:strand:+ start:5680 stop:6633 length:954 start_codon:yes stop_codon:yes gene_type:complete
MNFLLTGAAGFIGSAIAKSLLEQGHTVIGVDNLSIAKEDITRAAAWQNLKDYDEFIPVQEDINAPNLHIFLQGLQDGCGQIKIALHFAAMPGVRNSHLRKEEYFQNNVEATGKFLTILDFLNVQKLVFASSSSVYGHAPTPFNENTHGTALLPCSYYGQTKLLGEKQVRQWTDKRKRAIILRPFSVYGQNMRPDLAIPIFIRALQMGDTLEVFGDGSTTRDYTHIDDLLRSIHLAIKHLTSIQNNFEIVNVGTGTITSIAQLIQLLAECLRVEPRISFIEPKKEEMLTTEASTLRARNVLGFEAQIMIHDGLLEMIH